MGLHLGQLVVVCRGGLPPVWLTHPRGQVLVFDADGLLRIPVEFDTQFFELPVSGFWSDNLAKNIRSVHVGGTDKM
jgi:hypothetical protein